MRKVSVDGSVDTSLHKRLSTKTLFVEAGKGWAVEIYKYTLDQESYSNGES